MIVGRVVGSAVMTFSLPEYKDNKLLIVRTMGLESEDDSDLIALDTTGAGIGDTVLVAQEGKGARQILKNKEATVISVIVGIIDSIHIKDEEVNKHE